MKINRLNIELKYYKIEHHTNKSHCIELEELTYNREENRKTPICVLVVLTHTVHLTPRQALDSNFHC